MKSNQPYFFLSNFHHNGEPSDLRGGQLLQQHPQADIAIYRLNWSRGPLIENTCRSSLILLLYCEHSITAKLPIKLLEWRVSSIPPSPWKDQWCPASCSCKTFYSCSCHLLLLLPPSSCFCQASHSSLRQPSRWALTTEPHMNMNISLD